VGAQNVVVVTGGMHASWVRQEVPEIPRGRIIVEGSGRNTAASIALAALWILSRFGDAIMVVLPADHWIRPSSEFRKALRTGIDTVHRVGGLVTIGIRPTAPEEGFGYILPSNAVVAPGVRRVSRFVEKPEASLAKRMFRSGRWLWNCGVFVWRATAILEELGRFRPDIVVPAESWARHSPRGPWKVPAAALRRMPASPIDRAVLERSDSVLVVRGKFGWTDLGTWTAVGDRLPRDRRGNSGIGRVISLDSSRCLGINQDGVTVFLGVEDVVAVRSGNALLVCRRDAAQRVKDVVGRFGGLLRRFQ
jgi:mannose-1-phosphate guanylyltransferase